MGLHQISNELRSIVVELECIAREVESCSQGIGEKDCAMSLLSTASLYKRKLGVINSELYQSGGGGHSAGGGGHGSFGGRK